jgi:hypothetical protein
LGTLAKAIERIPVPKKATTEGVVAPPPQSQKQIRQRTNGWIAQLAYRRGKRGLEVLLVHPGGCLPWQDSQRNAKAAR